MAKARKTGRKATGGSRKAASAQGKTAASRKTGASKKGASASKKAAGGTKKATAGSKKRSAATTDTDQTELNLTALKQQIREHVDKLKGARTSDPRVAEALGSLQRVYSELESSCGSTMVIPLA